MAPTYVLDVHRNECGGRGERTTRCCARAPWRGHVTDGAARGCVSFTMGPMNNRPARPSVRLLLLGLSVAFAIAACSPAPTPFSYNLDVAYIGDGLFGTDAALSALSDLEAAHPELSVTYSTDMATLAAAIAGDPHLLGGFNQNSPMSDADRDLLIDYIADGGRLVATDWNWRTALLTALGTTWDGTMNETSVSFVDARLASGLTPPLPLTNPAPGWGTFSTGLAATTGTVAANFEDGRAAVVYANAGRTAAVGFLNDTVTLGAGGDFFANLFDLMLRGTAISGF